MRLKVYFEGGPKGPNTRIQQKLARAAFGRFAEKLNLTCHPAFIPCGSRLRAFEDFLIAIGNSEDDALPVLLVDSEAPVTSPSKWKHLKDRVGDGWEQPSSIGEDQVFLMVQCMETWLVADKAALKAYYSNDDFRTNAIPVRDDIENISKDDVLTALEKATANCARKGQYSKGKHSWELLSGVNPDIVAGKSPHALAFVEFLRKHCR